MEISVKYSKEKGFEFLTDQQGDMTSEEYYATLMAMAGYATVVISMMKADGRRADSRLMLEYSLNSTRMMFSDETVFRAIKEGIERNEGSAHKFTPEVVRSDLERQENN